MVVYAETRAGRWSRYTKDLLALCSSLSQAGAVVAVARMCSYNIVDVEQVFQRAQRASNQEQIQLWHGLVVKMAAISRRLPFPRLSGDVLAWKGRGWQPGRD